MLTFLSDQLCIFEMGWNRLLVSSLHAAHCVFSKSTFEFLRFLATVNFTLADSSSKCFMQNKISSVKSWTLFSCSIKYLLVLMQTESFFALRERWGKQRCQLSSRLHATAFSGILLAIKMLFFFVKCTVALLKNSNNRKSNAPVK